MPPKCEHCKAPTEAPKICAGCNNVPAYGEAGAPPNTVYCSKACQTAHWETHKQICKTLNIRRIIFQAGATLQDVFYNYRFQVFDQKIVKIDRKHGKIYVQASKSDFAGRTRHSIFDCLHPFPTSLVQSKEEEKAILTSLAADDALCFMYEMIKYFFGGTVSQFLDIIFVSTNNKLAVVGISPNGFVDDRPYEHRVVKLCAKNGEEYALDLTGAQWGYFEPIMPWKTYQLSRIFRVTREVKLVKTDTDVGGLNGFNYQILDKDYFTFWRTINHQCSLAVAEITRYWEKKKVTTAKDLFKKQDKEFPREQKDLVDFVAAELKAFLDKSIENTRKTVAESDARLDSSYPIGDDIVPYVANFAALDYESTQ
ncbi:hypothetical protein B0J14DRAFT_662149 [Halenospora varia]|nr:hypothetical protein B0J14DRAFT_662149 [Halenospora varia]